jgi:Flp pilus assembly protein TadG
MTPSRGYIGSSGRPAGPGAGSRPDAAPLKEGIPMGAPVMVVVPRGYPRAVASPMGMVSNRGILGPEQRSSRAAREAATRGGSRLRSGRTHRRRGASAVELALLLPMLLFILLGAVDFCRLFYAYTTITNCARNGALWLSDPLANGTVTPSQSPYATYQAAALADANGLDPALTTSHITSSSGTDSNGDSIISVTINYNYRMITSYFGYKTIDLSRRVTMRAAPATPE